MLYNSALVEEAVAATKVPLACNQVEYHPFLNQDKVAATCATHGMAMIAFCPLFRGGDAFAHPTIAEIAENHQRTPAQIILRWHVQQPGSGAIPRSTNPGRIEENLAVFDFQLSDDEMAKIHAMRLRNSRICDFEFSPDWD